MHMHMHMHTQGTRVRKKGPHQRTELHPRTRPTHPEFPSLCCAVLCCACWSCRHTVPVMPGYTYLGTYLPESESESKLSPSSTAQRGSLWIAAAA
jgi:hypothetical protein